MCLEYSRDMYGQNRDNEEVSGNYYFGFFARATRASGRTLVSARLLGFSAVRI